PGGVGASPLFFNFTTFINNILKVGSDSDRVGVDSNGTGMYTAGGQMFISSSGTPLFVNSQADTTIISIRNDTVQEGSISVSGTTVSYNAFLGSHWAELEGDAPLAWSIMETVDGPSRFMERDNLRLPKAKVAQGHGTNRVYG